MYNKKMALLLAIVMIFTVCLQSTNLIVFAAGEPTVNSFLINNGNDATVLTPNVNLNMNVTDAVYMQFSNDNITFSPWENYSDTKTWNILDPNYGGIADDPSYYPPGGAVKTVYAKFSDAFVNELLAYIKLKENKNYNLEYKEFKAPNGQVVSISGPWKDQFIQITIWKGAM